MEQATSKPEEKDYELECLVRSIKEVEMAKKQKPEKYKKALGIIKGEVQVISSIADLKKVKAAKDMAMLDEEESDDGEEE